jgi:DDE superfamily endonuclease
MGAFTPADVCNMDKSPLSLFGDQTKLSINDVNTTNEIEGHVSDKRFCTLILTVFGQGNNRVAPVVLFKGKGNVTDKEKSQYAKHVRVFFTPKAFNNGPTMDRYLAYWWSKVNDGNPKLFITDSSSTHLNKETIQSMRQKRVVFAIIPGVSSLIMFC